MPYRANLFLEVIGGIIASVIIVVLWSTIYFLFKVTDADSNISIKKAMSVINSRTSSIPYPVGGNILYIVHSCIKDIRKNPIARPIEAIGRPNLLNNRFQKGYIEFKAGRIAP